MPGDQDNVWEMVWSPKVTSIETYRFHPHAHRETMPRHMYHRVRCVWHPPGAKGDGRDPSDHTLWHLAYHHKVAPCHHFWNKNGFHGVSVYRLHPAKSTNNYLLEIAIFLLGFNTIQDFSSHPFINRSIKTYMMEDIPSPSTAEACIQERLTEPTNFCID